MNKIFKNAATVLILMISISLSAANFLWKVQSKEGKDKVFLLGSIHIVPNDIYPLNAVIEDSFDKSDYLVVEANINEVDMVKTQTLVMQKGMFLDGSSLEEVLSESLYEKLSEAVKDIGLIGIEQVNMMKPWLVYTTIPQLLTMKMGYDAMNGIDMHFLKKAKGKKEILELETTEFQLELLSGFSDDVQISLLESTLEDLPKFKETFEKMVSSWKTGNELKMKTVVEEEFNKKPELKIVYDKLINERNIRMSKKIKGYLNSNDDKTYFVVVGSGHLVGKEGIVSILKKNGFTVTKL